MISLCYNCHKEARVNGVTDYLFSCAEVTLLVCGILFALKVGGLPQVPGIAMLTLGGIVALLVDLSELISLLKKEVPKLKYDIDLQNKMITVNGINLRIYEYNEFSHLSLPEEPSMFFFYFPKDAKKELENIILFQGFQDANKGNLENILETNGIKFCLTTDAKGKLALEDLVKQQKQYYSLERFRTTFGGPNAEE